MLVLRHAVVGGILNTVGALLRRVTVLDADQVLHVGGGVEGKTAVVAGHVVDATNNKITYIFMSQNVPSGEIDCIEMIKRLIHRSK